MPVREMIDDYPAAVHIDRAALAATVELLGECAQACTACADACLAEDSVLDLTVCIRSNLDCADICEVTARILSRNTGYDSNVTRVQLMACVQACIAARDECDQHAAMHEHCRVCADVCRKCVTACQSLIDKVD
ncbi:four-helix bundle copper-binding protein [Actinomadura rayongensis]|jgi:hypothetical protein|uniref:Four-helix bundle copper-binding protein n=1 Tax=Actinomadura rayongensis TaxID=1429076 RepID=A0A6I4VYV4_9ACTN|nr:four-helix bundle copper-binding protein [Actinomadura rayongensis]MXQ63157.1 four-helix bundle copper-binding protein [Actinomadura rayongensis]